VPGVADVAVSLQPGTAKVAYDERRTTLPVLKAAIEDAGYGVIA
jgi:copper chaperone CopZ